MPSFAKQFNHTTSTYTCNSNSYSFFDNTGVDKYIRWTMVELSDLFFEDIKNILNETGLVENINESKKRIKVLGQEYTFAIVNAWDRLAINTNHAPSTAFATEAYSTPIPIVVRNGQSCDINESFFMRRGNSGGSGNRSSEGGYGVGNTWGTSSNSEIIVKPDKYFMPTYRLKYGHVLWQSIRQPRTAFSNNPSGNNCDFSRAAYPGQNAQYTMRLGVNTYKYTIRCYYNTNYVLLTFAGSDSADYFRPFFFAAKGIDSDNKNIHYFSGDPSSYVPGVASFTYGDGTVLADNKISRFSSYIPNASSTSTIYTTNTQKVDNILYKPFALHNIISLDESEMKEVSGNKIYKTLIEHQTDLELIFNTYDNFNSLNLVPRYVPKTTTDNYLIPLALKHNYGKFDNIYYTTDMSLSYDAFYEIDGETYYLIGSDVRKAKDQYYYNVLLKI